MYYLIYGREYRYKFNINSIVFDGKAIVFFDSNNNVLYAFIMAEQQELSVEFLGTFEYTINSIKEKNGYINNDVNTINEENKSNNKKVDSELLNKYSNCKEEADKIVEEYQENVLKEGKKDWFIKENFELEEINDTLFDSYVFFVYKYDNISLKIEFNKKNNTIKSIRIYRNELLKSSISNVDYISFKLALSKLRLLSLNEENFSTNDEYQKYKSALYELNKTGTIVFYEKDGRECMFDAFNFNEINYIIDILDV